MSGEHRETEDAEGIQYCIFDGDNWPCEHALSRRSQSGRVMTEPDLNTIRRAVAQRNDTAEDRDLFDVMAAGWIDALCDEVSRLRRTQSRGGPT